ncbi:hypothetical protein [Rhizorhabdus dicambivorans]|uniref:Uncharacterized protein n=1 Tax=Rhizorhabdus dicambivorans TaxID=1850238 RepID=A0A2A4FXW8_9SPHN|nr:hypothetical protein [Rhizorhabdus dicambivorans]ATE65346.1 hypothetical protein CMV14_13805 [Rhizorhabdus dicambivorans]PCE42325.1 hypothetical protein COO09_09975 [Rhizorhabdus dicambivorans]
MDSLYDRLPGLLTFRPLLYGILMWFVCIYAFLRGGWEERIAILVLIISAYLTFVLSALFRSRYTDLEWPIFLGDVVTFIVLQLLAMQSKKFSPLWLAAFSGVVLLSHLAPLMPGMLPATYHDAIAIWGYPSLIVLALGIANHHRTKMQILARPT